jgi:hypothetical protein
MKMQSSQSKIGEDLKFKSMKVKSFSLCVHWENVALERKFLKNLSSRDFCLLELSVEQSEILWSHLSFSFHSNGAAVV